MKKLSTITALVLSSFSFYGQIVSIPDANFKNILVHTNCARLTSPTWLTDVDVNNDGEIQVSEALNVIKLDVSTDEFNNGGNIITLAGLESFTNLTELNCKGNSIASLDLSPFPNLVTLECSYNQLTNLNASVLPLLVDLRCSLNHINQLNLSGLINLNLVYCIYNNLSQIDLSGLSALEYFACDRNQISNITFANNGALKQLDCTQNALTSIDLQSLPNLITLWAENNAITTLNFNGLQFLNIVNVQNNSLTQIDLSQAPQLDHLICSNNPNLTTINVRNNHFSSGDPDLLDFPFRFEDLPSLSSICLDNGEQNYLINTNYNVSGNVQIFGGENCDIPLSISVNSTSDFDMNNQVVLYPNPVNNEITVECKAPVLPQSILIYNALGQLVKTVPLSNASKTKTWDVTALTSGTYFIEIISKQGKTTKKFVKM